MAVGYTTGRDLLELLLSRADELALGLGDRENEAKTYLQLAYVNLLTNGFPWPWALASVPGVLSYSAAIDDTSVVTLNSPSVTLGVAPAQSVQGWRFYAEPDETGTLYRVSSHTAATTAVTLDSPYLGASGSVAAHLVQDEYPLVSDFLAPLGRHAFKDERRLGDLTLIGLDELQQKAEYQAGGRPQVASFIGPRTIRVRPWPIEATRLEYDYIKHPGSLTFDGNATTDTPVIQPPEHRSVLVHMAVAQLLVDKDDSRATVHAEAAAGRVDAMKAFALGVLKPRTWVPLRHSLGRMR